MFKTSKKKEKKYKFTFLNERYKKKLKERPIPSLKDTQKSFIKFIKPFLDNKSDTEYHEELFKVFINDEGNMLHKRLLEFAKIIPSWYYDFMLESFNLKILKPIPFFSNYFIVYDLNFKDQIDAFAKMILCSILLKRMIKDEKINELTMKDYTQYFCLFHSCRIPNYITTNKEKFTKETEKGEKSGENENNRKINNSNENNNNDLISEKKVENLKHNIEEKNNFSKKDVLNYDFLKKKKNDQEESSFVKDSVKIFDYNENKFVIVLYKNIFWVVETSLDYDHLSEQLLYITSLDLSEKEENFIGVLTGSYRNKWAKARHKFIKISDKNKKCLSLIERALMIFCISDTIYDRTEYQELFRMMWFNDLNNRFFDKIMQVIIFKDGNVCLNIEKNAVDISVSVEFLKFVKNLNEINKISKTVKKKILNSSNNGNLRKNDLQEIKDNLDVTFNFDINKKNSNFNTLNIDENNVIIINTKKAFLDKNIDNTNKNLNLSNNSKIIKTQSHNNEENSEIKVFKQNSNLNYLDNSNLKPFKLAYDLTVKLRTEIKNTSRNFDKEISSKINSEIFIFRNYGKTIFERKGVDMISYIQLAILSSYYRTYGKIVASRQFVCGRNFRFGIVEFVRTTIKESVNFIVSLNELRIPRELKIKLGQDFFKENKKNINDILNGKSIDVHLTGLYFMKKKEESYTIRNKKNEQKFEKSNLVKNETKNIKKINDELDENALNLNDETNIFNDNQIVNVQKKKSTINNILSDETFKKATDFIIETYPIKNERVKLCLQGYVNEIDGLSITYISRKNQIQFNFVSANDLKKYILSLEEILYEMKDLFLEKERDYNPKF